MAMTTIPLMVQVSVFIHLKGDSSPNGKYVLSERAL